MLDSNRLYTVKSANEFIHSSHCFEFLRVLQNVFNTPVSNQSQALDSTAISAA